MSDKMPAAEAAMAETMKALQSAASDAHDSQSRHAGAVRVLARMAEALFDAVHEVAADMTSEALEGEIASKK